MEKMNIDKYKKYAPIILRMSVSLVFLWFGINQLINPESFLGYVPQWLYPHGLQMTHEHPFQFLHNIPDLTVHTIIMANGIFETILGFFLLLGLFTRLSSLLLSLHLIIIMLSLGYNDIAVRDFGLIMTTVVVFINGKDKFCLENKIRKIKTIVFLKKQKIYKYQK